MNDAACDTVEQYFGEQGVMDLVGMVGYYTLLAMVLNTAQSPLPAGAPAPFSLFE